MSQSRHGPERPVGMPGTRPESAPSRRVLLKGFGAGAAALVATPILQPGTRAGATTTTKTGPPPAATTLAGLHGATLSLAAFPAGTTWAAAIADWEGYTATTIKASKAYYHPGVFPRSINGEIGTFISDGVKALLSFKPAYDPPTQADLAALENTLQMYLSAGLTATVTLWQEAQNVMTAAQFHRVFRYYGPAVRKYYPLAYDAAGSRGPTNWKKYYPGAALVDVVAIDYYATAYVKGITLDTIVAIADNARPAKPFGIWEMGNSAGTTGPAQSQMEAYFGYVQSLMAGRLQAGKPNADIVWYNGNGINTISSSSDYRVPLWDSLVNATS